MLSQELRPFDFDEMAGQEENKRILEAVIRNPEKAPKCLIFAGAFGSGKSTSARIIARRLNNITDRDFDLLNSQFYYEYDSTVIGNVDTIRQLRDQFMISYGDYYRVIVFDECHAISAAAQNALLKVLEEAQGKIIFVMCADGDGLVSTQDGVKRLKDIKSGDIVATEVGPREVKDKYYNGKKEVFRIETSQGNFMNLTENHRIRIFDGESWVWKKVKDLKIGDIIPCFKNFCVGNNSKCNLSLKQCEFLGRLFGDGWWTTPAHTGIIFNNKEVDYGKSLLKEAGIIITDSENCYNDSTASFFIHKLDVYGDEVRKKYGLLDYTARGDNKSYKHLPSEVFKMSKEQFDSFLFGWIGADGCFINSRGHEIRSLKHEQPEDERDHFIIYCSSKEAVYEAKCIAESFGYKMSISKGMFHSDGSSKSVGVREGDYTTYRLYTRKRAVTIPFSESKRRELMSEYSLLRYVQGCNWSIKMMKELHIDEFSKDVSYDKVISIESIGIKDVYDLEVPGADSFIYNGMSIHNCTTEPNKLLPTIRSRSLELDFRVVSREAIIENLTKVAERKNIPLSEEVKGLIADRSEGHMRNAHMLVDKFLLLGEQDFKDSIQSAIKWYCAFFASIKQGKKNFVSASINTLLNIPMEDLHSDWNTLMVESLKAFNGYEITHPDINVLVNEYGRQHFSRIIELYFSPWTRQMFNDMPYFQATLLNIYTLLDAYFYPKVDAKQQQERIVQEQTNSRLRAR